MNICKYFQRGNCRYGNRCWYEHTRGDSGGSSQRQLNFDNYEGREGHGNVFQSNNRRQQSPPPQQQLQNQQNKFKWVAPHLASGRETAPQPQQQTYHDIISDLCKEITCWETSNMWPLSCISFEKSGASIPGMLDISPDELRFQAYTALKNDQFQSYILEVQQMHNDYTAKRQELKNPSAQLKEKLILFLESNRRQSLTVGNSPASPVQSSAFGSSSTFGQSSFSSGASKVFGQGATNLFGKGNTSSSPFQGQGSAFGSTNTSNKASLFSNVTPQGNNNFGTSSVFGNASTHSPLQNPPNAANTQMNVFGNSSPSTNQNTAFGSVFGNSTLSSNISSSSGPGLFGKAPLISQPPMQNSVFGQPKVEQASVFGSAMPSSNTRSVFNQVPSGSSSLFASQASAAPEPEDIYTPLANLTPLELEQYQAQKFVLGKIPTRPPPKELCF
ncbi:nucleoporin-like protein 2 [Argonauta hians]